MRLKDEKFYKTVRDFLDIYLIKHRGYSLNTQKSYREAINLLLLYFKTELGLEYASIGFEDITYSNITGFLEWLSKSRGSSPATVICLCIFWILKCSYNFIRGYLFSSELCVTPFKRNTSRLYNSLRWDFQPSCRM